MKRKWSTSVPAEEDTTDSHHCWGIFDGNIVKVLFYCSFYSFGEEGGGGGGGKGESCRTATMVVQDVVLVKRGGERRGEEARRGAGRQAAGRSPAW